MCEFEQKVKKKLIECGLSHNSRLGVAVSGGADSISLLLSLSNLLTQQASQKKSSDIVGPTPEPVLYVITVNHNIRPAEESRGDVDFVLEVCESLRRSGRSVVCDVVEFPRGKVAAEAKMRGGGTEEAARALRYDAFESFITKYNLEALCLAHNKNDQLETLLMRFLQGSSAEAASGIKLQRQKFVRPLLDVSRQEIEQYVRHCGFSWRTDKTNYETDYLRNKIRHKLVPLLNSEFPGWQTSVLLGAQKAYEDAMLINSLTKDFPISVSKKDEVQFPLNDFSSLSLSLKYKVLLEACNLAGETSRIPRLFLHDVIVSLESSSSENFLKHYGGIDIIRKKNTLFIKKHIKNNTDCVFFDIIEQSGEYEFPFGILSVYNIEESCKNRTCSISVSGFENGNVSSASKISLPFCIRSVQLDDSTICADGSEKKVSDILCDWHISSEVRELVPVIQILNDKTQQIHCIFAGFLGYKDWIVKL